MKTTIRNGLIVSTLTLAIMIGVLIWAYLSLPDGRIPMHWNAAGEVDRWGDKTEALWALSIMPIVTFFTALVLAAVPYLEPRRQNLEKSAKVYGMIWIAVMVLLAGVHVGIGWLFIRGSQPGLESGLGAIPFVRFVIAGTGVLFLVVGNYLPKTRQNWFLGIRTPWTLSSEYAWEKTHRLAGRLFMLSGFVILIGAFLVDGIWLVAMLMACVLPTALISMVYSYFAWRNAPDKSVEPDYIV